MRHIRYQEIAEDIRSRVAAGEFRPGQVLPSESSLGKHYAASRVTIRRSLEVVRTDKLIDSRQGFGWFVPAQVLAQPLTGLATIEGQLAQQGRDSERRVLEFKFVTPEAEVSSVLGSRVLEVRRLQLSEGSPLALVTVWCREDIGVGLSQSDVESHSFYELIETPLGGASQIIGASAASSEEAELLSIPVGSAILTVKRTTRSVGGDALLMSQHVFPAHLTQFVVELPTLAETTELAPSLRLVE